MSRGTWIPLLLLFSSLFAVACFAAELPPPVGLGALTQTLQGEQGYSFLLESDNHFKQTMTMWDVRQYGFAQSRLEMGDGFGISLSAISGITVLGLEGDQKVAPHIGIEPFSGKIVLNTNSRRINYYEWLPMVSLGPQFRFGRCRFLPLVRGGVTAGDFEKAGVLPSFGGGYGAGTHLNCRGFDFATEATHGLKANYFTADVGIRVRPAWQLSLRAEGLREREGGQASENRFVIALRGELLDF